VIRHGLNAVHESEIVFFGYYAKLSRDAKHFEMNDATEKVLRIISRELNNTRAETV